MTAPTGSSLLIVERILRDRDGVWRQISDRRELGTILRQMLISSVVSLAVFGAVLGSTNGWQQTLTSTVKLPVLFLATLAICLPTLYLFNLVFGARLMMGQAVSLIMVSITVTSVLTLAFAPISLFFRITAQSYSFFKLLNVGILVLTAVVGLRFLTSGMKALNEREENAEFAGMMPVALAATGSGAGVEESDDVEADLGGPDGSGPAGAPVPELGGPVLAKGGQVLVKTHHPVRIPVHAGRSHQSPEQLPERSASMTLLYIWILLFGFVGTQLAWTLRPFFGSPDEPFQIFRSIHGTFYGDIFRTIGHLLGA